MGETGLAVTALSVAALVLAGPASVAGEHGRWLRPEQVARLVAKLEEREPFLASAEAREQRQTLNRFFGRRDYESLRGNPILGYWDATSFRFEGRQVAFGGIRSVGKGTGRISARAWQAAFRHAAGSAGLVVDGRAEVRVSGACLAAVIEPGADEPVPGVLLEMKVRSRTGLLRYRFAVGKPTVEDAIGAALEILLRLGVAVGGG